MARAPLQDTMWRDYILALTLFTFFVVCAALACMLMRWMASPQQGQGAQRLEEWHTAVPPPITPYPSAPQLRLPARPRRDMVPAAVVVQSGVPCV